MGGMGDDYFENKTRHLLPIAGKPLIKHLVETVDSYKDMLNRYVIIIEKKIEGNNKKTPYEEVYNSIFRGRDDVEFVGEDPLTQIGTFAAVKGYIDNLEENVDEKFPLLVLYGDTLVEKEFLKRVINKYKYYREKEEKSWIIWGLIQEEDSKCNVYCSKQNYPKDGKGFFEISGGDIRDCLQHPKTYNLNKYCYLYNTGIMAISRGAWDNIHSIIDNLHRPSPYGLFTFENIIKHALMFKEVKGLPNIGIDIVGIVAPKGQWYGANYPWEILELNKTRIERNLLKDEEWTGKERWTGNEEEIGQKAFFFPTEVIFTMSNGARIKGPAIVGKNIVGKNIVGKKIEIQDYAVIKNSYVGDGCTISDYAVIENSYVGNGCNIGKHTVIIDSTLVEDVKVNHDAVIENSVIMDNSTICYHAEVLHSIIGREVMIGSDVKTPCQRLKNVDGELDYPPVTYFLDIGIKKTERFGAIIGDYCQIGSGTVIHPGRRIGKRSKIYANCEILTNVNPRSRIRNKDITEIEV